ncbi:MAG: tetraacyldisaccharide 4'-kinase, partial [Bacteroidota bacterium]|nr:tetraacyldisaccharide 4'-kinase [Bacteroidota bacterium]
MISSLYAIAMQLRNAAYDRGVLRAQDAGVPVISVGNITAGGTGKTPVVEALLVRLLAAGRRPAMVTRGYRRESRGLLVVSDGAGMLRDVRESGDEPYQVAAKFPRVPVIADEKRIRGCRHAVQRFDAEILLLDDGFQHRAVARDCDIVVVDAQIGLDGLRMLPSGRLREPLRNLARA